MAAILVINPGSTSTKLAFFQGPRELVAAELEWHLPSGLRGEAAARETARYGEQIEEFLRSHSLVPEAVVGRGGFIRRADCRLRAGVYQVVVVRDGRAVLCEDIHRAVTENPELDHASNFGIPVAARIALKYNIPAFTVDPIVVDDLQQLARFSGYAGIERRSLAHVLSVRAMCRKAAARLGLDFDACRMVAVHLGGGTTVAAVRDGRIVDCNNALLGGGPFSPQRVGSLPLRDLIDLCYGGRFTQPELQRELMRRGGLISYLGDDDMIRISRRIAEGDRYAATVVEAMVYQIGKEIGAMAIAAGAPPQAIVFSGGLVRAERVMEPLRARVAHLAPLAEFPGSLEMEAMAHGAWRVLTGVEQPLSYHPTP
jgi:butyrate kinase